MKKIAGLIALAIVLSVGITAFADGTADYNVTNNAVTVGNSVTDYETVLITKDSDNSIVYVNQAENTFNASIAFLLKANPDTGSYTVELGGTDSDVETMTFTIVETGNNDYEMTLAGSEEREDGKFNVGFHIQSEIISSYHSIKVRFNKGGTPTTGGYHLPDFGVVGPGSFSFAFQINGVPEAEKDSIRVYLSPDNNLSNNKLNEGGNS